VPRHAIVRLAPEAVRPLRRRILRPEQAEDELLYPGDLDPDALHAGVRDGDGELVGIATVAPNPHPEDPAPGDWRLRGMATVPEVRGTGVGVALLHACLEHAGGHGGRRVWCTARITAAGFYERAGFRVEGGEFPMGRHGLHVIMARPVSDGSQAASSQASSRSRGIGRANT